MAVWACEDCGWEWPMAGQGADDVPAGVVEAVATA